MAAGTKIRILYVVENERYGGAERAFAQLIKGLDKSRFDVYAACLTGTPGSDTFVREISRSAQILPLDMRLLLNFSLVSKLRKMIGGNSIGIVHSQGPRADFYCRLALQESETAHVCTVASPVEEYDINVLRKALYIIADRFMASSVDRYIAVARHIGNKLIERGLPEESVHVVCNGVDVPAYSCNRETAARARAELGIPPDSFLVASFSRLSPEKNIAALVDAASMTLGLGIRYVAVGAGPLEGDLRAKIAGLGLEKDFILAGFMNDVKPLLWAADLVVLPSLREGLSMSVLEAMAAGKPVVASRIAGVDESVEDGETGLLVPPGDPEALATAIKSLAASRGRAAAMGGRAAAAATVKFGLEKMVGDHERIYKELAA